MVSFNSRRTKHDDWLSPTNWQAGCDHPQSDKSGGRQRQEVDITSILFQQTHAICDEGCSSQPFS